MPSAVSNGTNSVASRAHEAAMNLSTWTWAGWLKRTGAGESDFRYFNKAAGTAVGLNVTGQGSGSGAQTRVRGRMATGTSSFDISITNDGAVPLNSWVCVFVVFNQSDPTRAMRIFKWDGVDSVDEQTYASGSDSGAAPAFNTADLTFFNTTDGSQCYAGKAAHFIYTPDVWDNATMLDFAEGTLPTGLMDHYWPMQADLDDVGDVGGLHMTGVSVTFDGADSPPVTYGGGGVSGGSEAIVSALAEGAGVVGAAGGSDATVSVLPEGAGIKAASGASTASASAVAQGFGSKATSGGANATVIVTATGAGGTEVFGGSEATVTASAQGAGQKGSSAGNETSVTVTAQGSGSKVASGGSTATVTVFAEGAGTPIDTPSGGSEATVTVSTQGSGTAARSGSGTAAVTVTAEGAGTTTRSGGSEAIVTVTATGAGGSVITGPSTGPHTLIALDPYKSLRAISETASLIALEG